MTIIIRQEPLYLPSNSELQVSIWRLTNDRQIWYEWHAESFLTIPIMPPGVRSDHSDLGTPTSASVSQGRTMSPLSAPGPLADDESLFMGRSIGSGSVGESITSYNGGGNGEGSVKGSESGGLRTPGRLNRSGSGSGFEVVKIGHTSLHNPGGRSSWIGLWGGRMKFVP